MDTQTVRDHFSARLKLLTAKCTANRYFAKPYKDAKQSLCSSIQSAFPIKLYKCGPASDARRFEMRLEDISKGRLYLPYPSQFNDPYDADPYISPDYVERKIRENVTPENMEWTNEYLSHFMKDEYRTWFGRLQEGWADGFEDKKEMMILDSVENLRAYVEQYRHRIRIGCLTEDITNTTLWAHYADEGNGFAASYGFESPYEIALLPDSHKNAPITICPVIYSGRYQMEGLAHVPFGSNAFIPYCTEGTYLSFINVASHKEPSWSYEKEWRICVIIPNGMPDQLYLGARATELFLGENLGKKERAAIIDLGRELNIPVSQVLADHSSPSGSLTVRRVH